MTVRVVRLFHPTQLVPNLDEVESWFYKAFGRESIRLEGTEWSEQMKRHHPGTPTDYCVFTNVAEVLIESINPVRQALDGIQTSETPSQPTLTDLAWYVEGLDKVYADLMERGIGIERHLGSDPEAVPPVARFADLVLFWTDPKDTGLRYELYDPRGGRMDVRRFPGWTPLRYLRSDIAGDPLGIEMCAHHTVLTDNSGRALQLVVDVLGGTVIHEGRSKTFDADSVYVAIGDGVIEYATPDAGTPESTVWEKKAPLDTYYSMAFKVKDLEATATHLQNQGVTVIRKSDTSFVTDPATSIGTPWVFTADSIPGDLRT